MFNSKKIRREFPKLRQEPFFKLGSFEIARGEALIYLDSAATTLMPKMVASDIKSSHIHEGYSVHRGLYREALEATEHFEYVRGQVAEFINAEPNEIIFNSGATHGLNHLAYSLGSKLGVGDNVVITEMEHHANIVPWQEMAKRYRFELRFAHIDNYQLIANNLPIDNRTKIVSFTAASNVLGTISPVLEIIQAAKKVGAITIVDAAQALSHMRVDVKKWDCDFLVFSAHKMYGPTGLGVLYGKSEQLEKLDPFIFGGGMIAEVAHEKSTWAELPHRLEGGTPNVAGVFGLGAALQWIQDIGIDEIIAHETQVTEYLINQLSGLAHIELFSPSAGREKIGVVSFNITGAHPHDAAEILARHSVAVRAGHHCCMPLMKKLGVPGTVRASLGIYSTEKDIDALISGIKDAIKILR